MLSFPLPEPETGNATMALEQKIDSGPSVMLTLTAPATVTRGEDSEDDDDDEDEEDEEDEEEEEEEEEEE